MSSAQRAAMQGYVKILRMQHQNVQCKALLILLHVWHKETNLKCLYILVRLVLFNVSNCIRTLNSHCSVQNSVSLWFLGLVLSSYDSYTLRYIVSTSGQDDLCFRLSALSLGIGQVLSAALRYFNISVAPNCCAAVYSVQSICFCTHHICHILLSYI